MVYTHYGQKRNKQTDFNQYSSERSEHLSRTLPEVHVTKPRFGSKYSGVLRSPQKMKMFWDPHSRAL